MVERTTRRADATRTLAEVLLANGGKEITKIFFREMILQIPIGVHAHEQGRTQRVAVNLELFLKARSRAHEDAIENVFDYDRVRERIRELVASRHVNLQETVVDRIVAMCLDFEEVQAVRASTEKLDVYPDCAGVGYEVLRVKA